LEAVAATLLTVALVIFNLLPLWQDLAAAAAAEAKLVAPTVMVAVAATLVKVEALAAMQQIGQAVVVLAVIPGEAET
jgi:hypothetical protein